MESSKNCSVNYHRNHNTDAYIYPKIWGEIFFFLVSCFKKNSEETSESRRPHPRLRRWCFLSRVTLYARTFAPPGLENEVTYPLHQKPRCSGQAVPVRTPRSPGLGRLQNGAEVGKQVKIPCITFTEVPKDFRFGEQRGTLFRGCTFIWASAAFLLQLCARGFVLMENWNTKWKYGGLRSGGGEGRLESRVLSLGSGFSADRGA